MLVQGMIFTSRYSNFKLIDLTEDFSYSMYRISDRSFKNNWLCKHLVGTLQKFGNANVLH